MLQKLELDDLAELFNSALYTQCIMRAKYIQKISIDHRLPMHSDEVWVRHLGHGLGLRSS